MPSLLTSENGPLKIRAIAATDRDGYIGYEDKLLFHNPEDLKFFQAKTKGHICVMGRKTFESIGRILPGRQTVVVTSAPDDFHENCLKKYKVPRGTPVPIATADPFQDLPTIAAKYGDIHVWICGGGSIYRLFRQYITTYVMTEYSISVKEDGVREGYLPEEYDPDHLIWFDRKWLRYLNAAILDYGTFNGHRYTIRAYMKTMNNNTKARRVFNAMYGKDDPDAVCADEVYID